MADHLSGCVASTRVSTALSSCDNRSYFLHLAPLLGECPHFPAILEVVHGTHVDRAPRHCDQQQLKLPLVRHP